MSARLGDDSALVSGCDGGGGGGDVVVGVGGAPIDVDDEASEPLDAVRASAATAAADVAVETTGAGDGGAASSAR